MRRYKGGYRYSSLVTYVADSVLHLPHIPQPKTFSALRRWLRALHPHVAPVLFVSTAHAAPLLLREAARTHASHASVSHVQPDVLPRRLKAAVVGLGFPKDSFAVLPAAASAYFSAAGALAIPPTTTMCDNDFQAGGRAWTACSPYSLFHTVSPDRRHLRPRNGNARHI